MTRLSQLVAFFLLVTPSVMMAQRCGRPDGLYNRVRTTSPQLLLQLSADGKSRYFRPSDLRRMPRSTVILIDAETGKSHVYEGVPFDQLLPNIPSLEGESLKISFGSHEHVTILGRELNAETKPLIADTVDGKRLTSRAPYYFVARSPQKPPKRITEVWCIAIKSSS